MSAAVAGDLDEQGGAAGGGDIAIGMGKAAQECVQNRMVERRQHDAGAVRGEADLLLMVPALGELARDIEPDERCHLSGPGDADGSRSEGVERFVVVGGLRAGQLHERDQDRRTEPPVDSDALTVEPVDERDDVLMRADVDTFDLTLVASSGQFAQSRVEQVRSDITNAPLRCDGRQLPLGGIERGQQIDEMLIDLTDDGCAEDGLRAAEFHVLFSVGALYREVKRWHEACEAKPIGGLSLRIPLNPPLRFYKSCRHTPVEVKGHAIDR